MTNEHSTPALPEGTIEITLHTYGILNRSVFMSRSAAERFAEQIKATGFQIIINGDDWFSATNEWQANRFRIISTRLEDDTPNDPSKGRVVAICVPLPLKSMEVK